MNPILTYKKSSFSIDRDNGTRCVEVAISKEKIYLRHSVLKEPVITYTLDEWEAFLKGVKNGEFEIK